LLSPEQTKLARKLSVKAIIENTTSSNDTGLEVVTTPEQDISRFKYLDKIVNAPNNDRNRELITMFLKQEMNYKVENKLMLQVM
jgi:hypothetical protein